MLAELYAMKAIRPYLASAIALIGKVLRHPAVNENLQCVQDAAAHGTKERPDLEKYKTIKIIMEEIPVSGSVKT